MTDYNCELERLRSFENYCTDVVSVKKLALCGMYNFGSILNDFAKCNFCDVEIGNWEAGDNVLTDHLRYSPGCELLRRRKTKNIPITENELEELLPPATACDVLPNIFVCSNAVSEYEPQCLYFKTKLARVRSFDVLLQQTKEMIERFSVAGFYYTGRKDFVKCFECGLGLGEWRGDDEPWQQHAIFNGNCKHLRENKGQEYIDFIVDFHKKCTIK